MGKKRLKERKEFRNQMIMVAITLLGCGFIFKVLDFVFFGGIFAIIALWNIISYRKNVRDYNKLNQ